MDPSSVPASVRHILDALSNAGHGAWLVGGCVRDLVRGERPSDFDVVTSAPPEEVLRIFPRAVPIGLRHGTVMIPTPDQPVDVTSFRAGPELADDLAHRDFTLNAMAYDPRRDELVDPHEGREDLARGRLRAVGSARERFAEDPLRALRAARLVAALGFEIDPGVEAAMRDARPGLASVAAERVKRELAALLLAPHASRGLALLRRTGLEADLAPGADAAVVTYVDDLPFDLELRLAAWLRTAKAAAVLKAFRFGRRIGERTLHLQRGHPIEAGADATRLGSVRRLMRRVGEGNVAALLAWRRAELRSARAAGLAEPDAEERLEALAQAVERVRSTGAIALRRSDLALDGREVMEILGCGPGPEIGRALRHLTDCVIEDPSRNTPDGLRKLLEELRSGA